MRWLVAVALAALLAGCLEQPAPPAQAEVVAEDEPERTARQGRAGRASGDGDEEEERTGNVTLRSYSDQYGLVLTSANAVFRLGSIQGNNCVAVDGAPYHVLNGTATLTWDSQSVATDSLAFEIRTYYTSAIYETFSGPSPLVVEFGDLEVEEDQGFADVLQFGVQLDGPAGASYEQEVALALAFEYESDIDVASYATYC